MTDITKARAERIAKAHACVKCEEYSYKRVRVTAAPKDKEGDESLDVAWLAEKTCGVCGAEQELGISRDGTIVYVS